MSETEHRYDILNPWIECRPTDNGLRVSPTALPNQLAYQQDGEVWWKNVHKIYIRVERNPRAEINKYVLPLFIIVLMATLAFGMDPADTNERLAVAMTAMIGVAQTKLSMPQAGDSNWLVLHSNCCLVMIMIVLVESLMVRPEFATEDTASWVDRGFFIGVAVLWVFPHAIVWCNISCAEPSCGPVGARRWSSMTGTIGSRRSGRARSWTQINSLINSTSSHLPYVVDSAM